ncbi:MAG: gamma-glutamylcyclotransferase family protein [Candidatus Doudnabacteria bacterium]
MYYFAYGSNMNQSQMKARCPESKLIDKGYLKDYKLDFLGYSPRWKGGCADIARQYNSKVWGLVYEVSKADINLLDKIEGNPDFYKRMNKAVFLSDNRSVKAEMYFLVKKQGFVPPTKKYIDIILEAGKEFEFPKEYQKYIGTVPFKDM